MLRTVRSISLALLLGIICTTGLQAQQFRAVVEDLAEEAELTIADIDDTMAGFIFDMPGGGKQLVVLRQATVGDFGGSFIELQVPSIETSAVPDQVLSKFMILLLSLNPTYAVGFWAIDVSNARFTFMQNYTGDQLENMTGQQFRAALETMVSTVERIESEREQIFMELASMGVAGSAEDAIREGLLEDAKNHVDKIPRKIELPKE